MSSAEALLDSLGDGLGPWSYALVGALAFLETSAFVGLVAPGELAVVLGGVLAGRGQMELPLLVAVVWAAAVAGDVCGFLLGRGLDGPSSRATAPASARRRRGSSRWIASSPATARRRS